MLQSFQGNNCGSDLRRMGKMIWLGGLTGRMGASFRWLIVPEMLVQREDASKQKRSTGMPRLFTQFTHLPPNCSAKVQRQDCGSTPNKISNGRQQSRLSCQGYSFIYYQPSTTNNALYQNDVHWCGHCHLVLRVHYHLSAYPNLILCWMRWPLWED